MTLPQREGAEVLLGRGGRPILALRQAGQRPQDPGMAIAAVWTGLAECNACLASRRVEAGVARAGGGGLLSPRAIGLDLVELTEVVLHHKKRIRRSTVSVMNAVFHGSALFAI